MSAIKISDMELLRLYKGGRDEAISELLERHTPRLRSYIRLMVRDGDKSEDILQDVLIKAVKMIDSDHYTDNGRLLSWLLRIAHNMTIDAFRSQKNRPVTNESEAGYDILGAQRQIEGAIEDDMVRGETQEQVRALIELLPEDQKEVIRMRYYSELSFNEIAEMTGVSINTALGRMRYALINLRKLIKDRKVVLI